MRLVLGEAAGAPRTLGEGLGETVVLDWGSREIAPTPTRPAPTPRAPRSTPLTATSSARRCT